MSIKLVDHPYFTRSKGLADSFPNQNSDKGKTVTGDNNEEVSLIDVVVAQPTIADLPLVGLLSMLLLMGDVLSTSPLQT